MLSTEKKAHYTERNRTNSETNARANAKLFSSISPFYELQRRWTIAHIFHITMMSHTLLREEKWIVDGFFPWLIHFHCMQMH